MDAFFDAIGANFGHGVSVWLVLLAGAALACGTACCCCGALVYARENWHSYSAMSEDVTELTKSKGWWGYNFAYVAVTFGLFVMGLAMHQLSLAARHYESAGRALSLLFLSLALLAFMLKWGIEMVLDAVDAVAECFRGETYEVDIVYEWTCSTSPASLLKTLCGPALCACAAPTIQLFGERNKMQKPKRIWRMGKWWGGVATDVGMHPFRGRRTGVTAHQELDAAHPELRVSDQITRLKIHISKWAMPGARKLEFLELSLPPSALLLYVHTITVRLRKPGKTLQEWEFPAYTKLGGNTLFARVFEAEASIPWYDAPEVKAARKEQLARNKELWRWQPYTGAAGLKNGAWKAGADVALPSALDAGQAGQLLGMPVSKQAQLPINSLFGVSPAADFVRPALQGALASFGAKFGGSRAGGPLAPWASAREVLETYGATTLGAPQLWSSADVSKAWQTDTEFCAQLLQGVWPDAMAVPTKLPPRLSAALKGKRQPESNRPYDELCRARQLLLVDLSQLGEYAQYCQEGGALTSCYILLSRAPSSKPAIKLEAILLWWKVQGAGAEQQALYSPADEESDWLLGKSYARSAMATQHFVTVRLLHTHLCVEPYVLAARRCLSTKHPLFKMLWPHIRYTLMTNYLTRAALVGPGGALDKMCALAGPKQGHILLACDEYAKWDPLGEALPAKLGAAGLMPTQGVLPEGAYPYRDAALPVWALLREYVARTLKTVYKAEADLKRDSELQEFLSELEAHGFPKGRFSAARFSSSLGALTELLSTVLWTMSGRHAATNFLQYDQGAYGPNWPLWMRQYPPPKGQVRSTDEALAYMCPRTASVAQAAVGWALSEYGSPWLMLNQPGSGDRYQELFATGPQLDAVHWLAREMDVLEVEAKKRARTTAISSRLQYVVLVPSNVPTSVAI